ERVSIKEVAGGYSIRGAPADLRAVILDTEGPLGSWRVVLIPDLGYLPAQVTLRKSAADAVGTASLGHFTLGDSIPTTARDPEWARALASIARFHVLEVSKMDGRWVPTLMQASDVTSFEEAYAMVGVELTRRTEYRPLDGHDARDFQPG